MFDIGSCKKLALIKRPAGLAVWNLREVFLAHTVVSVTLQYGCKATRMNLKWIKMIQEGPSERHTTLQKWCSEKRAWKVTLRGLGEPCPWCVLPHPPTMWGFSPASRTAFLWTCLWKLPQFKAWCKRDESLIFVCYFYFIFVFPCCWKLNLEPQAQYWVKSPPYLLLLGDFG